MQPAEIAKAIAKGGNVQAISDRTNFVFRVWREHETAIVKVYSSLGRERRERRALEALAGMQGVPRVLGRKSDADPPWVVFADAGSWTLATLTGNLAAARRAGEILRGIHEASPGDLSNLAAGMDSHSIGVDFIASFQRLGRYRRKLGISQDLLDVAMETEPPSAGEPRTAHTRPGPESFIVAENGEVTLVGWGWATLAPPEWDFTYALWRAHLVMGAAGADAFAEGYGRTLGADELRRWFAYHAGQALLTEAETQEGRLDYLRDLIVSLEESLANTRLTSLG